MTELLCCGAKGCAERDKLRIVVAEAKAGRDRR
ncbi:hypothetical protein J2Y55_002739 [Bosea sp. BE125]|nr:hypothetical protein [Bosea sp. BE125]